MHLDNHVNPKGEYINKKHPVYDYDNTDRNLTQQDKIVGIFYDIYCVWMPVLFVLL